MEDIKAIEEEIRLYYIYIAQIPHLEEKLFEISSELNSFGIHSPKIRSTEEVKYQRGTVIYSDRNLLELIFSEELMQKELEYKKEFCIRIKGMLDQLSPEEQELIEYRYKYRYSLRLLAQMYLSNKDSVYLRLSSIIKKIDMSVDKPMI